MSAPSALRVGAAYDAIASGYDRDLRAARAIRRALWSRLDARFSSGDRVIDVGAGTGIDSVHLASRDVRVTAIDASAAMLGELRAKLAGTPLEARVDTRVGDAAAVLDALEGSFDGAFASFAALNTMAVPGVARALARLVRPGGAVVLHLLSPMYFRPLRARLAAAIVPLAGPSTHDVSLGGEAVPHWLIGRRDLYEAHFRDAFVLRRDARGDVRMAVTSRGRFVVLDLVRRQGA